MIKARQCGQTIINLDGPEGNAMILLGYAKRLANQLSLDSERISIEMTAGDYTHLVRTFDKYFGDVVVLETNHPALLYAS